MERVLSEGNGESAVVDGELQLRAQGAGAALGQADVAEHVIGELLLARGDQSEEDGLEERDDARGGRSCWKRDKRPLGLGARGGGGSFSGRNRVRRCDKAEHEICAWIMPPQVVLRLLRVPDA